MIPYNNEELEFLNKGDYMFNFNPFKLPNYKEVKESTEKLYADSVKFFEEWVEDFKKHFDKK